MLSCAKIPDGLTEMFGALRGMFSAPGFATFQALVDGALRAVGEHAVTSMWIAAGLAGRSHWSRGHRFFSHTVWSLDGLGLGLARMVAARFAPVGPLVLVIDDTLFHRSGRKVFGAFWQHDGSAAGRDQLGRGNNFVIAGLAVTVPFMARRVLLPVLFRLHRGKGHPSKNDLARQLAGLIAAAFPGRDVDVVADAGYHGPAWKHLPDQVTFTTRLAANAALFARPAAKAPGKRGHPVWKGPRLPCLKDIAAHAAWHTVEVTAYAKTVKTQVAVVHCLWWGSLHRTPVRLVLARTTGSARPYDIALITTDLTETAADIVARYSWRWSIEQSIRDAKTLLGTGGARNRLQAAVERTVPFQLLCLTILYCWYAAIQDSPDTGALAAYRTTHPWDRAKTHVSVDDMIIAYRRARITALTPAQHPPQQNTDPPLTCTPRPA